MERKISEVVYFIENNLKSEWTPDDLAKNYHYSSFHFSRVFKEITGFTLAHYIRQRKLVHILYEISLGAPKEATALAYGFSNYSSFYRAINKFYGCGPKTYLTIHSVTEPKCPNFLERGQIMYTKAELTTILTNWSIGDIEIIEALNSTNYQHQLWQINEQYI